MVEYKERRGYYSPFSSFASGWEAGEKEYIQKKGQIFLDFFLKLVYII